MIEPSFNDRRHSIAFAFSPLHRMVHYKRTRIVIRVPTFIRVGKDCLRLYVLHQFFNPVCHLNQMKKSLLVRDSEACAADTG